MALGTPNTILLKIGDGMHEERFAGATPPKPGHFVVKASDDTVSKNTTAGYDGSLMIAKEDSLQGKTINDVYVQGEPVFLYEPQPGDLLYARLPANAAAIVVGDAIQLDNTGCVKIYASGRKIAMAQEAKDNSANGAEAFIRIKIAD